MANPFYNARRTNQGPFGLIQQFNEFRSTFQGDPKQKVQELLNSGQMTQEQFNQLSNMAKSFQTFVHK